MSRHISFISVIRCCLVGLINEIDKISVKIKCEGTLSCKSNKIAFHPRDYEKINAELNDKNKSLD